MDQQSPRRQQPTVDTSRFTVHALDGYPLATRRWSVPDPRAVLVVAGATGVPQGFYRAFAERAAVRGYDVVTFDYRGIGESAPATLRGFRMDYRDWGRLDLAGVLEDTADDDLPIHLVSHSYGGQALGLLPDPSMVRSMHAYGSGSGWHGWMPKAERGRVAFLWNVLGPLVVRTYGYLAWSRFGMGEDLPVDVYHQWKHWCRFPAYWFDDPEVAEEMRDLYARIEVPITAVNSVDDPWITPAARDAFFTGYSRAPLTPRDLHPADIGRSSIGHMGYFRRGSERLWDELLGTLDVATA
jgi:predicted alpha/beta hydrolase